MADYFFNKDESTNNFFVYIPAYNQEVNVNEQVYAELTRSIWREEKQDSSYASRTVSLSTPTTDELTLEDMLSAPSSCSPELTLLAKERAQHFSDALSIIKSVLTPEQYALLSGTITESEYAHKLGISQPAAHKQKQRLLSTLREELDDELLL